MGVARTRTVWALGAGAAVVACAAVAAVVIARGPRDRNKNLPEAQARADEREGSDPATPVKAVHPRKDASLRVTVRQLLSVQPFLEVDLRSRVAGVVSGANGINPGIQLQQQGALDAGKNVALTGRVYVQADASNGPIRPGDLLTTASTLGHAMRVTDHLRAQGAILGKAMTGLSAGKGMVLVLVTLQ